jgi:hypothetical protein
MGKTNSQCVISNICSIALRAVMCIWSLLSVANVHALDWHGNFAANRHSRFYTGSNPQFIGGTLDWSGVGVYENPDGWWWATLISDRYFLSAAHIAPDPGTSVRFFRTNDPNGEFVNLIVAAGEEFGQRIAGTDLWLGKFQEEAPSWVRRYPLIKRNELTYYPSYLPDSSLYIVGYEGGTNNNYTMTRLGRNHISSITHANGKIRWTYDTGPGSFDVDEVDTIGGDSSGPTFVTTSNGQLVIAGTHYSGDSDTSVSSYIAAIDSAVPEPLSMRWTPLVGQPIVLNKVVGLAARETP